MLLRIFQGQDALLSISGKQVSIGDCVFKDSPGAF